jgi:lauroyl/myristoyl acyltransferase
MNVMDLTSSAWAPNLVRALCKTLPRQRAYEMGDHLASSIARQRQLPMVQASRRNLAMVLGYPLDHPNLNRGIEKLFRNLMRGYIDLFRAIEHGPSGISAACEFSPPLLEAVKSPREEKRGLVLVGAHACSFDLVLLALKGHFPDIQALTKGDPGGNSQVMNELRKKFGIRVTPICVSALREAVQRLRSGGVVVMAADVPVEHGATMTFFQQGSLLPTGHARLALKADAEMIVGFSKMVSDGRYRAEGMLAHCPTPSGDRERDAIHWAQRALTLLERFIRERPYEWFMPEQLWPSRSPELGVSKKLFTIPSPRINNPNETLVKNCGDQNLKKLR